MIRTFNKQASEDLRKGFRILACRLCYFSCLRTTELLYLPVSVSEAKTTFWINTYHSYSNLIGYIHFKHSVKLRCQNSNFVCIVFFCFARKSVILISVKMSYRAFQWLVLRKTSDGWLLIHLTNSIICEEMIRFFFFNLKDRFVICKFAGPGQPTSKRAVTTGKRTCVRCLWDMFCYSSSADLQPPARRYNYLPCAICGDKLANQYSIKPRPSLRWVVFVTWNVSIINVTICSL